MHVVLRRANLRLWLFRCIEQCMLLQVILMEPYYSLDFDFQLPPSSFAMLFCLIHVSPYMYFVVLAHVNVHVLFSPNKTLSRECNAKFS